MSQILGCLTFDVADVKRSEIGGTRAFRVRCVGRSLVAAFLC